MSFTGFYLVLLGFTGFYWVLLGFTEFYLVLLGFTGFYLVLPGDMRVVFFFGGLFLETTTEAQAEEGERVGRNFVVLFLLGNERGRE